MLLLLTNRKSYIMGNPTTLLVFTMTVIESSNTRFTAMTDIAII